MNRIYALIWSVSKHAWVVASELTRAHGKANTLPRRRHVGRLLVLAMPTLFFSATALSQQIINGSTTTQSLNSSTSYQLNEGQTVTTSLANNAVDINGIAPVTFTNLGRILGTSYGHAGIAFNVTGSLINEESGLIHGTSFGAWWGGSGANNNLLNRGDISASENHAVHYTGSLSGTIDNYGTINGGAAGAVGTFTHGLELVTTGAIVVNNHLGASIHTGMTDANYGFGLESISDHQLTLLNDGSIVANQSAVSVLGTGSKTQLTNSSTGVLTGSRNVAVYVVNDSAVRNAGTISSPQGAITFAGSNNTLIVESTSSITGNVLGGTNGTLILGGGSDGNFNLSDIGDAQQYRDFSTFEKRELSKWTLTGMGDQNWRVVNGTLILDSGATLTDSVITIDPSGTFQYGNGGTGGALTSTFINNGLLMANQAEDTVYAGTISGTGGVTQLGPGKFTFTGDHTYTGTTSIAPDSVLQLGTGGTSGRIAGSLLNLGQLILDRSDEVTFDSFMSGSGSLLHTGAGLLTLTGDSTYTGGTTIDTGSTLRIGGGGLTGSLVGDIINNGTLIADRTGVLEFGGVISGSGGLTNRSLGTLRLTAVNTFGGPVRFESGTLEANQAGNFGTLGNSLIFDGGALRWLTSFFIGRPAQLLEGGGRFDSNGLNVEWRSSTTGLGQLTKTGEGTLFLTGSNTYGGGTLVVGGNLQLGMGSTTGSVVGDIDNRSSVTFNRSNDMTFAGIISGTGSVTQVGPGVLTLTGQHTYTGGTTISGGSLQLGNGGSTGGITGNVVNNGTLIINRGDSVTDAVGLISGSGGVIQGGSATLTLTRNHTYTGLTTIESGTLRIGAGGTSGAVAGNILNNATLIHDRNDLVTYAGSLSGIGNFQKNGTGTLILSGSNPFSGNTQIDAGQLLVDGSLGGAVRINGGATLGGIGALDGLVTVANGGHLAPGDSPGVITVGSLLLDATSQLDYELGLPAAVGSGLNDLTSVDGDLTLDGELNITDVGGFGNGVYRLFDYGGTLTNNGLSFGVLPLGFSADDLLLQTGVDNQINLIVSLGGLSVQFWDGANEVGNGAIDGGSAIWNTATTRWTNSDGSVNAPWQNGMAVFSGTAGNVALGESILATDLQFLTDGYDIQAGTGELSAADGQLVLRADPGLSATISAAITDGAGVPTALIKRDAGTVILTGSNTYTGGTRIEGGSLGVRDNSLSAVSVGGLIVDDGTLSFVGNAALTGSVTLLGTASSFAVAAGSSLTVTQAVEGAGVLGKSDAGSLIMTADNLYTGGTLISAGVLQLGAGGTSGSVRGDITNNGQLVFNRSNQLVIDGVISGSGSVVQQGSGVTLLNAANSYLGGTFINAGVVDALADDRLGASSGALNFNGGTLHTGAGFDSSRGVVLTGAGTLEDVNGAIFRGIVSGSGELTKTGVGKTTLTANNVHTGGTRILQGSLQLGDGRTSGSVTGNIENQTSLIFNRSDASTHAGVISGSGDVTVLGGGSLALTGANSYAGANGTQVRGASTLLVANNGNLGAAGLRVLLDNGSTLRLTTSFALARDVVLETAGGFNRIDTQTNTNTLSGMLSGEAGLQKLGSGTLVLTADNSYGGGTSVAAGTLQIGAGGSSGSVMGNISNAGSVVFNRSGSYAFAGAVSGTGSLSQAGSGVLILTGDHSYSGNTTISSGTLQLGNGGTTGSLSSNVVNNGSLIFNRSDSVVHSHAISGSGSLSQTGTGSLTLTAANSFSGLTTVAAGRLQLTGSLAGAVQVQGGAIFGGTGSVGGVTSVANGGRLAPGTSPGTLSLASLTLNASSELDFELGLPNVVGGGVNDWVDVGGNLTLDGNLNISDAGAFGDGVYRLFDYGGNLTNNGLAFGTLPGGFTAAQLVLQTTTANQINLVVSSGGFGLQFWDGPNTSGNGTIEGGTAVWNAADSRWTNTDGSINVPWQNGFAVFQGNAGTVTLGQTLTLSGAQFRTNGYVLAGAGFNLQGAGGETVLRVDPQVTATVAANVVDGSSAVSIVKTDLGTLVLNGNNSYSGGTTIRDGVLQINADAALGAATGSVTLEGATLAGSGNIDSSRAFFLREEGGRLAPASGTRMTLGGVLAGEGGLEKLGAGTLVLSANNTIAGGTRVSQGVLGIRADNNLGASNAMLALAGGTLRLDASFSLPDTRPILISASAGTIDTQGNTGTVQSAIQGAGGLTKAGAGRLILTGENAYLGNTLIQAGSLQVGAGGNRGRLPGDVLNQGVLIVARSDVVGFDGLVSGSGQLIQQGPGTLILSADHQYTGGTTIAGGTLQLGDGTTTGSVLGNILDNGALVFARSNALSFAGVVSGSGSLRQQGAGMLTLTGNNGYVGGTTITTDSILQVGSGGTSGSVVGSIVNNGRLIFNRSNNLSFAGDISGTGSLQKLGAGELQILGNVSETGLATISSGTLRIGNGSNLGTLSASSILNHGSLVFHRSDSYQLGSAISGTGGVEQRGTGTLVLGRNNTYSGGTLVSAGTLQIGDGVSGSIVGNVVNQGSVVVQRDDDIRYAGVISGVGSLTQNGAGTLTLSGVHTFTGLTTVADGRLRIDGQLAGAVQVNTDTTLAGNGVIAGRVTIADGAHLAPGASAGTLTVGELLLSAGSMLDYELGMPNAVGGGINDLIEVRGNLTLDGTLNVSDLGGFGDGVYRLINYAGQLTDNGLQLGALPPDVSTNQALVQTGTANEVNLVVSSSGFELQFWDGPDVVADGSIDGGSALWDGNQAHWTNVGGTTNANWQSGFAVFSAEPGTVTLGADVSVSGMQFSSDGYTIGAGSAGYQITADAADTIIRVDPGSVARIDAAIVDGASGPARLIQRDRGLLILNGDNNYTGGTWVGGGVLQIASDHNLGAAGTSLVLDGGTLASTTSFTSTRPLTLTANHGVFAPVAGTTLNWAGNIGGAGGLSKIDEGTLVLGGSNQYAVGTFLAAGILQASRDANLGRADAAIVLSGGTLRWGAAFDPGTSRDIVLAGSGRFDTQTFTANIAQAITGDGGLIKLGNGRLILAGDNVYAGNTRIEAGTLQLGSGGTSGSLLGDIDNRATLLFARSDDTTFAGTIVGSGQLVQQGPGMLTLSADQGYTGLTTITDGKLMLGQGGSTGSVRGDIANAGELLFNRVDNLLYAGTISGTGSVTKLQAGTLVLTGENVYTGGTTIEAGQLRIGNGGSAGSLLGDVSNHSELAFNRSDALTFAGHINGQGSVRQLGSGVLVLSASNGYSGGTFLDGGVLSVANDASLGADSGEVFFDGGVLRLTASFDSDRALHFAAGNGAIDTQGSRHKWGGLLDGSGTFIKLGDGTLILNYGGTQTGGTQVLAGTLVIGDSAHPQAVLREGPVMIAAGASLGGYGAVIGAVSNDGTLGVGNALPALANEPDASFTIAGNLSNRGVVSMLNGMAADQLVIRQGAFIAVGGAMQLETVLNGGGLDTQSDQLIADAVWRDGNGITGLQVNAVGGNGQVTDGDGIRVVDVAPGGRSDAGAFALLNRLVAGSHEYLLFQGGLSDPADGDWYLRSEANEQVPILRPEAGSFLGNRFFSERMLVHTLHQRQGEPDPDLASEDGGRGEVWANVTAAQVNTRSQEGLLQIRGNSWRLQAGVDVQRHRTSGGGVLRWGPFLQYGQANSSTTAAFNPASGRGDVHALSAGVYASWLGDPQQLAGAYIDSWWQYGRFDNRVEGSLGYAADYDAEGWAGSLEAGYAIALGSHIGLVPQLQYIRMDLDTDGLVDRTRTRIQDRSDANWLARVGVRVYGVPERPSGFSPFVELNGWRRSGNSRFQLNQDRIEQALPKSLATLEVGMQGVFANGWNVWLRLGSDLTGDGYREINGGMGVRYSW